MPSLKKKDKRTKWLAVWDCYGLESLWNITEIEEKRTFAILKEESSIPSYPPIHSLTLRASLNIQRNYEIYLFTSVGLTEEDIKSTFLHAPQQMADFIRTNGVAVYENRSNRERVIT